MNCYKCNKDFNAAITCCGTGTTWSLHRCPYCNQLHATGSIIPKEAVDDNTIVCIHIPPIGIAALKPEMLP